MPPETNLADESPSPQPRRGSLFRFRPSVLRGLALILPPVLTIVILVWIASTIELYLLNPVENITREIWVQVTKDIREAPPGVRDPVVHFDGEPYVRLASGEYIPEEVHSWLRSNLYDLVPEKGEAAYRRYVSERYLRREIVVPVFLCVFVLGLYFLGKWLAFGTLGFFERAIRRLPLVRSVYSSVKKVTNFVLVDKQVQYKRVVAVEYPRKGIWSIGLVTSDSVSEVVTAAREPCVTVVLPGSPTPITGYCVMVPTRETYDLHMTIEQALQFYVSCGVAVPKAQHVDRHHGPTSATAAGPLLVDHTPVGEAINDQRSAAELAPAAQPETENSNLKP